MHFLILILLSISFIFLYYFNPISKYINLLDIPDKKRKIHSNITPKSGGIVIFLFAINYFIVKFLNEQISLSLLISIIISCLLIFIIFLVDDLKDINANLRLILVALILLFFFMINETVLIKELKFISIAMTPNLNKTDLFFSILCVLLLINAVNLMDGINGLCVGHFIIWLFILNTEHLLIQYLIYTPLLVLIYFNLKGKIFLGNTGSILIGFIISISIITQYKFQKNLYIEDIFIYLMIPGLDMFRLFIKRIINKKNPFSADQNHLHHLLYFKYRSKLALIFYLLISFGPAIISYFIRNELTILVILFSSIIYFFIIYKLERFRN